MAQLPVNDYQEAIIVETRMSICVSSGEEITQAAKRGDLTRPPLYDMDK